MFLKRSCSIRFHACAIRRITLLLLILTAFGAVTQAQDDLLDLLEAEEEETTEYAIATFKTARINNGQSVETQAQGVLYFIIGHRFGRLNGGVQEFFGLDNATIRLGFAYGITDRLTVGIGRSSFEKTYDGYLKYKLLRQSKGLKKMPLTLTLFGSAAVKTLPWPEPDRPNYTSSRYFYTAQALIARKFTDNFSLQLSPTLVHRNLVATTEDANDVFVLGVGGRYKLTGSLAINAEYFWIPEGQIVSTLQGEEVTESFSIGVDLETGGHVFQLFFTNSRGMVEKTFLTETTGSWLDGDVHFGFNISRVFTTYDPVERKEKKAEKREARAERKAGDLKGS